MAQLNIITKRLNTPTPVRKALNNRLGGALKQVTQRLFKTLSDAIQDGQVGANFFWK